MWEKARVGWFERIAWKHVHYHAQRVGHAWATELNWTEWLMLNIFSCANLLSIYLFWQGTCLNLLLIYLAGWFLYFSVTEFWQSFSRSGCSPLSATYFANVCCPSVACLLGLLTVSCIKQKHLVWWSLLIIFSFMDCVFSGTSKMSLHSSGSCFLSDVLQF